MALYVIGDVQGCYDPLMRLLDDINFDANIDTLWFAGDLVNRGPQSVEVLRFVKQLPRSVTVLGNHDLHLLAIAYVGAEQKEDDTLSDVLNAHDCDELLDWLRHRPLMHRPDGSNIALIHAGLAPHWTLDAAKVHAEEVEAVLRSDAIYPFLEQMYGNKPPVWREDLLHMDKLRFFTNCLTRLRYVTPTGELCLKAKGPLGTQPESCVPWFQVPDRKSRHSTVFFGHWSTLGFHQGDNVVCLDTGCLWGQNLTAAKLSESGGVLDVYHHACPEFSHPHRCW